MIIDPSGLDTNAIENLLTGSILPRAIGWVSSMSKSGVAKLAPISFFTVVGRKPPMVSLTLQSRDDGALKDTFVNIRDTGEFVTNMVTLMHADHMHRTSFEYPAEVDEFDAVGLKKEAAHLVRPWRVKDAPICLECKLTRIFEVGAYNDHVVWGEVVRFHVRDDLLLERGRLDIDALLPVGRLAGGYALMHAKFAPATEDAILSSVSGRR
jgi:flavin reductase (DIM6/NTAB) family NADH-FMN oxidoreductase RutF